MNESERLAAVQRMSDIRHALKQGTGVEQRAQAREKKADRWCDWFRRKMDQGHDPLAVLPDMCAELEERITDEVRAGIKELKDEIAKGLGLKQ